MPHVPLSDAAALLGTLRDFFHVAVHSLLFYRRLYPARTFLSATAFGVAVHQSRHPQVCAWIGDAIDHVLAQLAGGAVETVAVVVHAPFGGRGDASRAPPLGAVLERWVFDVRHLPAWPGGADALAGVDELGTMPTRDGSPHRRPVSARPASRQTGARHAPSLPDDDAPWDKTSDDGDGDGDGDDDEDGITYSGPGTEDDDDDDDDDDAASEAELDAELRPQTRPVDGDAAAPPATPATVPWPDLHHQLRAAVQRLAQTAGALAPLPPQCTFTMAIEVGDDAELRQKDGTSARRRTAWVPEQVPEQAPEKTPEKTPEPGPEKTPEQTAVARGKRKRVPCPTSTTTTIRTVDAAPFFMECWVEESAIKNAADAPDGFAAVLPPPKKGPAGKSVAFDSALHQIER